MREHFIINVGRQLGSGGRIIGQQIAKDFEIGFYDKEILDLAARESGYKVEMFERNDEQKRFFKGLYYALTSPFCSGLGHNQLTDEALFKFQSDAIRKAAEQRSCLFVGRCADYVLRDYVCSVNIFITANLDDRICRISTLRGISNDEAEKICLEGDRQRANYYNYYTTKKWGMAESYNLCINSSDLGIPATIDVIEHFISQKIRI